MLIIAALIAGMVFMSSAEAQSVTGTGDVLGTSSYTVNTINHANITIACGQGSVMISTKDGSVKFDNCEPDDAARRFWDAVTRMFPGNK